jgi:hypothetical protein
MTEKKATYPGFLLTLAGYVRLSAIVFVYAARHPIVGKADICLSQREAFSTDLTVDEVMALIVADRAANAHG